MFNSNLFKRKTTKMNWNILNDMSLLDAIDEESNSVRIMIMKHSTRCSISGVALSRIESNWKESDSSLIKPYYLDILNHRDISFEIEKRYGVQHESPQVLILSKGKCLHSLSHTDVRYNSIIKFA